LEDRSEENMQTKVKREKRITRQREGCLNVANPKM
jgi:hypothetical protein